MSATALASPKFVRRTRLGPDEYRKNFRQIDEDIIAAVSSREADAVTPLMSKIYLRLVSAPAEFWEREGVLHFTAGDREGRLVKASKVLYEVLGVSSATAHKALQWMHERGIIGYFAGKNGVGVRIFLNRASASIGVRAPSAGKKILPFGRGSNEEARGSTGEPAFKDSYADLEVLEKDLNPRAPKNGADAPAVVKTSSAEQSELAELLLTRLGPLVLTAAAQAAAREHERTREWFESRGLPKAVRVAQREAYNVLRQCAGGGDPARSSRSQSEVGRGDSTPHGPQPLSSAEVEEFARACVALFESQGRPIERSLSEMSVEAGGFLLPDDAAKVRSAAEAFMRAGGGQQGG